MTTCDPTDNRCGAELTVAHMLRDDRLSCIFLSSEKYTDSLIELKGVPCGAAP